MNGAWVFRRTRVPVAALLKDLEGGASVAQFLERFPGVTLDQVRVVLEHAALAPTGDLRLENDPRFLERIARARADLRAGRGVPLEDIEP